jgi:alpha-tubulin suppressor-like RCC1 family protein
VLAVLSVLMLVGASVSMSVPAASNAAAAPAAASAAKPGDSAIESWGDNSAGELGDGSLQAGATPVAVLGLSDIAAVSAGDRFNLVLRGNETVVAWGDNGFGQLGNGTTNYSALPVVVKDLSGVTAVAAGGGHSLALLSNGTVMAWGDNQYGQLGDGSTVGSVVPVAVPGLTGVTAVAAGSLHSMALLDNGTVEAWGYNGSGQLGDGTFRSSDTPATVSGLTGITQVAAGGQFSIALENDGTVRAWGANLSGELGDGTNTASKRPVTVDNLTGAVDISASWYHSLALLPNGEVDGWGDNTEDMAEPEPVSGAAAVAAGGAFNLALLPNGTVEAWGDDALDQLGAGTSYTGSGPVMVSGLTHATAISAGANHALALVPGAGGEGGGSAHPSIWQDVASPNPDATALSDTLFDDVSAATTTDGWAVGESYVGVHTHAIAAHWNGSSWTAATLPNPPGTSSAFSSVVDLAPDDAWAVGWACGNGKTRTLSEHWDGTTWSIVSSPDPLGSKGGIDELQAVAGTSPDDVWAFGNVDVSAGVALLYLRLIDGTWHVFNGPSGGTDVFTSATAIASNDEWAVGDDVDINETFSVHWNGTTWAQVTMPQLNTGSDSENWVTGISAAGGSDVWASGYEQTFNPEIAVPYVLHNSGSGWILTTVPTLGGEGSPLHGVAVLSANDVWVVGQTQQLDGSILTLTEQFDGTSWSIRPSLTPGTLGPYPHSSLAAVTSSGAHDVLGVGSQDQLGEFGVTLSLFTTKG